MLILLCLIVIIILIIFLYLLSKTSSDHINEYFPIEPVIIVPYGELDVNQERKKQYNKFIDHFRKLKNHPMIFIAEQKFPISHGFNKGKLLNSTTDYLLNKGIISTHSFIIFHDIDMLPDTEMLKKYYCGFKNTVFNLLPITDVFMKIYGINNYPMCGGIFSTNVGDFISVNGFPNLWNWGGEDVELSNRYIKNKFRFLKNNRGTFTSTDDYRNDKKQNWIMTHKNTNRTFDPLLRTGFSDVYNTYKIIKVKDIDKSIKLIQLDIS